MTSSKLKAVVLSLTIGISAIIVMGLFWLFVLAPSSQSEFGGLGWYLFSFAAGLTMIVLPCTLPLAFVIVPMAMGKGIVKGLGMALSFGLGVSIMLSLYGVAAALVGAAGIDLLGADLNDIKNWVYFIAGIFAFTFAVGEVGLVRFRMPSYTGSAPAFIQKRKDYLKALLLGLFLGNIGVGCPHPATPLILIEIASSGDVMYGWLLFLVHAIGRVLPLILLALLGVAGVNGLAWLVARKDKVEKATGWAMVFIAGFILTLGLFTHDWWVNSGQHNLLEMVTQEQKFTALINENLESDVVHSHGLETGQGIFGQPLEWGNWFIVIMWVVPIWWWWLREKKRVLGTPALKLQKLQEKMDKLDKDRKELESALHLEEADETKSIMQIEAQIAHLEAERREYEEHANYGEGSGSHSEIEQRFEESLLQARKYLFLTLTILLFAVVSVWLPHWFVQHKSQEHAEHGVAEVGSDLTVKEVIEILESEDGAIPVLADEHADDTHAH